MVVKVLDGGWDFFMVRSRGVVFVETPQSEEKMYQLRTDATVEPPIIRRR